MCWCFEPMTRFANHRNCLHLVVRSTADAMERCRSQFAPGDAIVFLDDGVMHFASRPKDLAESELQAGYFSAVDLEARGLLQPARDAGIRVIGDSDFVRMLREFKFCVSWK